MLRVLAVKRISRDTEQSSALLRQDVALANAIRVGGFQTAGWVEDATVSGSVNLVDRKSLGQWLKGDALNAWDILMVTEQDRITRDDLHWHEFVGFMLQHGKTAIVLDDPSLDLTTTEGRMIAGIKAGMAAKYRESVRDKRLGQTAHYREENLWAGGTWPYGYRAERFDHDGKSRWRLVLDPITSNLRREAFTRILAGHPRTAIVADWNERGIHTPQDHQRAVNAQSGRENVKTDTRGSRWSLWSLREILTNPSALGYATHRGEIRRGKDGMPIVWAEPIVTREEFETVQVIVNRKTAEHKAGSTVPNSTATDLVSLLRCGGCTSPLHSRRTSKNLSDGTVRKYSYYKCQARVEKRGCVEATSWPTEFIKEYIGESFLSTVGHLEIETRTFVPGSDRTGEIEELSTALENLYGNLAHCKPGSPAAKGILGAIEKHSDAMEALKAEPVIPSRYIVRGTGKTFAERWNEMEGWGERGDLLRDVGVLFYFAGSQSNPNIHAFYPDDLARRIGDAEGGRVDSVFIEKFRTFAQSEMVAKNNETKTLA